MVVESYLGAGRRVAVHLSAGSINLSPASIRNVMQELEELGLLAHPHTSAGRIPTESGLRLFVDGIMQAAAPEPGRPAIERADRAGSADRGGARGGLGGLVRPLAPGRHRPGPEAGAGPTIRLRATRRPARALAVLVGAEGSVENRVMTPARAPRRLRSPRSAIMSARACPA